MKCKFLSILIISLLIFSLLGCNRSMWNKDITFECESVNNTLSAGNIAYANHKLYVSFEDKLYEISNGKRKTIDTTSLNVDDSPYGAFAEYFNFNDELYAVPIKDDIDLLMKYDCEKDEFVKADLQINPSYGGTYLSDNLCVWTQHNSNYLYIRYNDKVYLVDIKTTDVSANDEVTAGFSIYNDIVYFVTGDGSLYSFDVKQENPQKLFISTLENISGYNIRVIKDICYYCGDVGVYSYSLTDGTTNKISDDYIYGGVESINDNLYFSTTKNGIYCVDGNKTKKVSDISGVNIYLLDNEYIYTYSVDKNINRIKIDTGRVEAILETTR